MIDYSGFPLDALPEPLRSVVLEAQAKTKAPIPLLVNSMLSTISLVSQGYLKVQRPGGLISPVSLYILTQALSGERKTTVDTLFMVKIREFEHRERVKAGVAAKKYRVALQVWDAERKALLRIVQKNRTKGIPNDDVSHELELHEKAKPKAPKSIRLIYNDVSPAALKFGLHSNGTSAGVMSDEAGSVLNGLVFDEPGMFNSLWGGSDLVVDRRGSESFTVHDPSLTVSLMIQPGIFQNVMKRRGTEFRDIGFLSRFLVSQPLSTQGWRFNSGHEPAGNFLNSFGDRVTELLEKNIQKDDGNIVEKRMISMSPSASARWLDYFNYNEANIQPGRHLHEAKDYAAKICDNLSRIAALLQYFTTGEEIISEEMMARSIDIVGWYGSEFLRLFTAPTPIPQIEQDARDLSEWLRDQYWSKNVPFVYKAKIPNFCPNHIRNKKARDALDHLAMTGRLWVGYENNPTARKPKSIVMPIVQQIANLPMSMWI